MNDCFMALGWTPEGGRVTGRPKTTRGGTFEEGEARWGGRAGMWPRQRHVTGGEDNMTASHAYWRN